MGFFKDRYTIIQNIIARSGGIDRIDLASELAKSESMINQFSAQSQMEKVMNVKNNIPVMPPQPTGDTNGLPPDQSITPEQNGSQMTNMPQSGKYDNL
jgi:hypothetical protein